MLVYSLILTTVLELIINLSSHGLRIVTLSFLSFETWKLNEMLLVSSYQQYFIERTVSQLARETEITCVTFCLFGVPA